MKKQPREAAFSSGAGKTVEPFYENKYFTNTNGFNAIWSGIPKRELITLAVAPAERAAMRSPERYPRD
jgi:hypothetical protein